MKINKSQILVGCLCILFLIKGKWIFVFASSLILYVKNEKIEAVQQDHEIRGGTLQYYARGRDNNFNLIRLLLAWGVLIAHSYPLADYTPTTWFDTNVFVHLGEVAVNIFFIISGFFISKSFMRHRDIRTFFNARLFRILPALIAVILISALILGPLVTTLDLSQYFKSKDTWSYLYNNISLKHIEYELPGVFHGVPHPIAVNGSLWSVIYEMRLYLVTLVVGSLGLLTIRKRANLFCVGFILWYFSAPLMSDVDMMLRRVTVYFFVGFLLLRFERNITFKLAYFIVAIILPFFFQGSPLFEFIFAMSLAYITFYLAYKPNKILQHYNKLGDYSYGFYLYAFPVQQVTVYCVPGISFGLYLLITSLVTLILSVFSWHLIEKRALTYCRQNLA